MVGELICVQGRGRGKAEPSWLGPLAAARWTVYVPEGLSPRRLARRLLRAEELPVGLHIGLILNGLQDGLLLRPRLGQRRTPPLPSPW